MESDPFCIAASLQCSHWWRRSSSPNSAADAKHIDPPASVRPVDQRFDKGRYTCKIIIITVAALSGAVVHLLGYCPNFLVELGKGKRTLPESFAFTSHDGSCGSTRDVLLLASSCLLGKRSVLSRLRFVKASPRLALQPCFRLSHSRMPGNCSRISSRFSRALVICLLRCQPWTSHKMVAAPIMTRSGPLSNNRHSIEGFRPQKVKSALAHIATCAPNGQSEKSACKKENFPPLAFRRQTLHWRGLQRAMSEVSEALPP